MAATDSILIDIEAKAKFEYLPILGAEKAKFLTRLVGDKKPCRVVEVGLLTGYATIVLARSLPEGCLVVGLEISEEMAKRTEENVLAAGLADKVEVLRGDARERLGDVRYPVDVVLLDAQRTQYLSYLKKLEPKLSPGAVIVANGAGAFEKELRSYLDHVRKSPDYQSSTLIFGDDAMEVSIYKKK